MAALTAVQRRACRRWQQAHLILAIADERPGQTHSHKLKLRGDTAGGAPENIVFIGGFGEIDSLKAEEPGETGWLGSQPDPRGPYVSVNPLFCHFCERRNSVILISPRMQIALDERLCCCKVPLAFARMAHLSKRHSSVPVFAPATCLTPCSSILMRRCRRRLTPSVSVQVSRAHALTIGRRVVNPVRQIERPPPS